MLKKGYKIKLVVLLLLFFVLAQAIGSWVYSKDAVVTFFMVGQGDSALIQTQGKVVVIDGGPDNSLLRGLGESLSYFERQIDYLIISHDHDDHVVGLVELINRYRIQNIIYGPTIDGALIAEYFRQQAKMKNINLYQVESTAQISLGNNCNLKLLNSNYLQIKKDENNSLTVRLSCLEGDVLFTGDNHANVEAAIIDSGWDIDVDILKAGHHGSKTSSSQDFLVGTSPDFFIISAGAGNSFGHPHQEVLDRVSAMGALIRRTDTEGSIKFRLPSS